MILEGSEKLKGSVKGSIDASSPPRKILQDLFVSSYVEVGAAMKPTR